jgi:predicted metal-dependent hydrolase
MPSSVDPPSIVCFVNDLLFESKIDRAAQELGFQSIWIETAEKIDPDPSSHWKRQPAEHMEGPGARLIDHVTGLRPALMIFDLSNSAIPWSDWLPLLKSVPATRRFPAICYGSHVDAEAMALARRCGAEAVFARSRFVQDLPGILRKYAMVPDAAVIEAACRQPLSSLALRGLELFNRGEYFTAHELLEEAWNEEEGPGRELYRAILQVAVAYLQIERLNFSGATKMFWRVRQWIDPLPDTCRGVDVLRLRQDAEQVYAALITGGKEGLVNFDRKLLRPVIYWGGSE